ncbi:AraC family transcriptional regulator [bacterium]|nr:AraC family transcriptional regulator [bacterium]
MTGREHHKYILEGFWQLPLQLFELSEQDVLRRAELPLDLFQQRSPTVTGDEIYRIAIAIDEIKANDPTILLRYIQTMTLDAFSPVTFACVCSQDLNMAATRIAQYKPLVGPARLTVNKTTDNTEITISQQEGYPPLPRFLVLYNLLSLIKIARTATRTLIIPVSIAVTAALSAIEHYEAYFGVPIQYGDSNSIVFSAEDAQRPFLSPNPAIWSVFEPELQKRMTEITKANHTSTHVRACLNNMLASGQTSIDEVAARLSMSPRTLQRRLRNEGTSFQQILNQLRQEMAYHYLLKLDYSSQQIAYLLGYEETRSFFRAFRAWTGQTPEAIRAAHNRETRPSQTGG